MSRNKKFVLNAVIVILVIALLGGGIYFLTLPEEEQHLSEIITDDDEIKIFSYEAADLQWVSVSNQYGDYSLQRQSGGWVLSGFEDVEINASMVDTLVYTFVSVTSPSRIEREPADLSLYGLDSPAAVLSLKTAGSEKTFYIGDQTPDGNSFYFNTDSSSDVYTMESYMVDVINLTARDYADIGSSFTAEEITAVRIESSGGYTLGVEMRPEGARDQYGLLSYWDITEPKAQSASNSDVSTLLTTPLAQLENDISAILAATEENAALTGLDNPEYTVWVTTENEDITYEISPASEGYRYIRRTESGYILRVDSEDCDFAALTAYDIAEKYLALVDITLVNSVTIEYKGKTTQLAIVDAGGENAAFYADGMEVDSDEFRTFYSHIVALDVSGEAENPQYENIFGSIEYRLNTGETIKLEFAPYDERNYAVFVDGEGLYCAAKKDIDKVFAEVEETF